MKVQDFAELMRGDTSSFGPEDISLVSEDGRQVDICGHAVEVGPDILMDEAAVYVGPVGGQSRPLRVRGADPEQDYRHYTEGSCVTVAQAADWLNREFGQQEMQRVDTPLPVDRSAAARVYDDEIRMPNKKMFQDIIDQAQKAAWSGSKASQVSLQTPDGRQVDIRGKIIETGYEFFESGVEVRTGRVGGASSCLFDKDARCMGSYDFRSYTKGCKSIDAAAEQLAEMFHGSFLYPAAEAMPPDFAHDPAIVYDKSAAKPELTRLVWKDEGPVKGGHAVSFAKACDEKKFGQDDPVANPYLKNLRGQDGSVRHAVSLSDTLYQNLKKMSAPGAGPWAGVVEAQLLTRELPNRKTFQYPDLSDQAIRKDMLVKPIVGLDLEVHDSFVKQSLAQMRHGQLGHTVKDRPLPSVPESEELLQAQMGE